jgi:ectoine hydroxylase-related dioxygenase (phytanoyl-CoA dioxygenase family)
MLAHRNNIKNNGFDVIEDIYIPLEIRNIISAIDKADQSNPTFRKTDDLFAIRVFLKEVPEVKNLIITQKLKSIIHDLFGKGYFVVKSIYFDKPEKSNWFVAWHQDLTVAVNRKVELPGYGPWTVKLNNFGVQPPIKILQNNFTVRIHLDDTDKNNGALKVIKGSHLKSVYRVDNIDWQAENEELCDIKAGGIMIMRPLLMHASDRSTINQRRRVIHIEFSAENLPVEIDWAEKESI